MNAPMRWRRRRGMRLRRVELAWPAQSAIRYAANTHSDTLKDERGTITESPTRKVELIGVLVNLVSRDRLGKQRSRMKKRSISDAEISLIKAMVARGMKNRDIQFYFNTPDRAVNSGRITGITKNTYSNSAEISPASEDELDTFLANWKIFQTSPDSLRSVISGSENPVSETTLKQFFESLDDGTWHLAHGETDKVECKKSFDGRRATPWLKAVAALANNRGGYIFFGVGDKDERGVFPLLGLQNDNFSKADPAQVATLLRSSFDPTPHFKKAQFVLDDKLVGVLFIDRHPSRPVISTKNEGQGEIREGDIFFRYPGQSARISYSDLRAMLDERAAEARAEILPMVQRLISLGPERAMVADLNDGQLLDGKHTIQLAPEILEKLVLIKEGDFSETVGAPALRLIGNVQKIDHAAPKKGLVTREDMRMDFLNQRVAAEPIDYIRCAIEIPGQDWVPIRYFGILAKMSRLELIDFINANKNATTKQRALYVKRLASSDQAFVAARAPSKIILSRLAAGNDLTPADTDEAIRLVRAIQGLKRPLNVSQDVLRTLLLRSHELIEAELKPGPKSELRRAIARLDELTSEIG
jgi:hypothetical protein